MKSLPISGDQLLKAAYAANKLTADQKAAYEAGKLKAQYFEFAHRAQVANTGTGTGVALFDLAAEKDFGLSDLDKGCKLPEDFALIATKARVGVLADDADGVVTAAQIKAMSFDNLVLALGGTTERVPATLLNSRFILNINEVDKAKYSAKNYFLGGNSKEYIEGSMEDAIAVPDGVEIIAKGSTLTPKLELPIGVPLSTPASGAGSKQYVWETLYIGFRLVNA